MGHERRSTPTTSRNGSRRAPRVGVWRLLLLAFVPGCVIPISTVNPSADGGEGADGSQPSGNLTWLSGAPTGTWTNDTGNLANMPSQCGNLSHLIAKPDEDLLIAGIAGDGLWGSRDGGASWQLLGTGSNATAPITNRTSAIVFDPQNTARYWESGLYNSTGVYSTSDDGTTYLPLGNSHHCDLVSIDFTDPNRQTLLAGGHEQSQTLNLSTDGGMTWSSIGIGLPPSTNCTFPLVIGGKTFLVGCGGFGGGVTGVWRSIDSGMTWASTTTLGAYYAPLVASDGSIYWSSPNDAGMGRSTDQGQTWSSVIVSPYSVVTIPPIELPDGRIATLGPSTGDQYVLLSADHGATWKPASAALPYSDAFGVTYSSQRKAFYVWHWSCGSDANVPVPTDAVMSFPFDYTTN
jgi:hypothetical protein